MDTITTQAPPAAEPAPVTGTVALRQPGTTAATGAQRRKTEPIDGALLWLLVRKYLTYYVSFRKPSDADLATGWVFHAVARNRDSTGMGQLIWRASPRLLLISRSAGAGKSTLLDLIVFLTGSRRGKVPRLTPARLAQITGQARETVCIDEGRLVFGAGAAHADLQACLLAGYTPHASYEVSKTSLDLFGSVVIASKESLITEATKAVDGDESSIGDLLKRCLKMLLTEPDIPRREVGEQAEADGALLCRALIAWTDYNRDDLKQAARDIAEEDYQAALERASRGEKKKQTLRADQIARPLRAIGRVIGPGAEEDIAAALAGADEATEIMTELQDRPWAQDDIEDEPGRIVYADEPEDDAPAGQFTAGHVEIRGGKRFESLFAETWPTLEAAQRFCAGHADAGPLDWNRDEEDPGVWTATFYEGTTETTYVVTETTGE